MKRRKVFRFAVILGLLFSTTVITFALTSLFYTQSIKTNLNKKTVFQFNLNTELQDLEVGPGDSFSVKPSIYNDGTDEMYVFIKIEMPCNTDDPIYTYETGSDWILVNSDKGIEEYAYGSSEMIPLQPGETTTSLFEKMTMKSISYTDYAGIDDINVTITGYAIGTEDISTNPVEAWNICKELGDIE